MKASRLKLPWMGLAFSALTAFLAQHNVERAALPGELNSRVYLKTSLLMASTAIIPIFSTVFAATLIAAETSRGTLRMLLPHPISRASFLHAKLLTGLFYLFLMFLANLAVALPIASTYPFLSTIDEGMDIPGLPAQVGIFTLGLILTYLPHAATVCFAMLVSILSRSVATAIGVAVGIIFCLLPIQVFVSIGTVDIGDYIFSSYYDSALGVVDLISSGFHESWNQENMRLLLSTSLVSSAVFLATAYLVFTRKDLNG